MVRGTGSLILADFWMANTGINNKEKQMVLKLKEKKKASLLH